LSDKLIDQLAEEIAEHAKKAGKQEVYDMHEHRSYENYRKTAEEAGVKPASYSAIKKANEKIKHLRSKVEAI